MLLDTTITAPATDRAANLWRAIADRRITVFFGRIEGAEFRLSHAQPSRTYATEAAARKAAAKWIAAA